MREADLEDALRVHDELVARCAIGELGVRDFLAVYDSFYPRWALDGHEGGTSVLARHADRIEIHRRIWDEVECHITSEEHAGNPAHRKSGFIGEQEALSRLRAIAKNGGLADAV